jgi:multiple sugar transport system substrate-binding protein
MLKKIIAAVLGGCLICSAVFAKSSKNSGKKVTLNVMYKEVTGYTPWLEQAKAQFEAADPNVTVKLLCLPSTEADYNTKTALTLQTDNSVDVMVTDSFLVASLVGSDCLAPLDVSHWADWNTRYPESIRASQTINGKVYAVPYTTDTRGLYYNAKTLEKAGIKLPWQPESWADILDAVKKLHAAGVAYPIWMNASKAQGEGTSMQTFEMLLSGTNDWLYENGKWVTKSKGFTDSLKFIQSLRDMGIYTNMNLATMLDANGWQVLPEKFAKGSDVGILLDGCWKGADWINALGAGKVQDVVKVVPMPKQNGSGSTSMSGGWTLAVSKLSGHKDVALEFIKLAVNKENMVFFTTKGGDMTVRSDVGSDPRYMNLNYYRTAMTPYIAWTRFRPAVDGYPSVSIEIQTAVESVISGQKTAEEAAAVYNADVRKIVGKGNFIEK